MKGLEYVLGTVLLTVFGQLLLKWRVTMLGTIPTGFGDKLRFIIRLLMDPWVILALGAALIAAFLWMIGLTRFSLSVAYPLVSLSFVLILTLSHVLFGEQISTASIIGVALVVAGVAVIGLGQ